MLEVDIKLLNYIKDITGKDFEAQRVSDTHFIKTTDVIEIMNKLCKEYYNLQNEYDNLKTYNEDYYDKDFI